MSAGSVCSLSLSIFEEMLKIKDEQCEKMRDIRFSD